MRLKQMMLVGLATSGMILGASLPTLTQAADKKPNILFIMGDDIGWMQVGAYQNGMGLHHAQH